MKILTISQQAVLTERELEYLSLVALGLRNKIVANYLCVSVSTVKKTLENIFRKLNAKDRTNAVAIAFLHNLITSKFITKICDKYNLNNP